MTATNFIYVGFLWTAIDFNQSYVYGLAAQAGTGKGSVNRMLLAAATQISCGNIAMWTVGSASHALYDCFLWTVAGCVCFVKGGIVEKIDRYNRIGSMAVTLSVAAVALLAMVSVVLRMSMQDSYTAEQLQQQGFTPEQMRVFLQIQDSMIKDFFRGTWWRSQHRTSSTIPWLDGSFSRGYSNS
jgi:hypothetical protein